MRKISAGLFTIVSFVFLISLSHPLEGQIRTLVLTGKSDLPYHHWKETSASIRRILEQSGRFEVRVNEEPGVLSPATLKDYDVVVLNYNGPRWSRETETAIEKFVEAGGGLVAVHQAIYGEFFGQIYRDGRWQAGNPRGSWEAFANMIGASWAPKDIGHARRTVFAVKWKIPDHPVSSGQSPSFMANDELYHKITLKPTVQILADAESPLHLGGTGKKEPMAWTNQFGQGRVFFTPLGHDPLAWHEPGMANLLARGTEWAATSQVTVAPFLREHSSGHESRIRLLVVTGGHSYPTAFYAMLDSLQSVTWTHAAGHGEAFSRSINEQFDAVLLHDMFNVTTDQARARLKSFVEAGKGVLSLHHSIVDYTDWPWWYQEVTGGKYFVEPTRDHIASQYLEDEEFLVTAAEGKQDHPVLRGIGPLWVYDELYKHMYHSPKIEVLMETAHPENDRPVVYVGPHDKARVVYVQLGHSEDTMKNPGFRHLIENTIKWIARRTN